METIKEIIINFENCEAFTAKINCFSDLKMVTDKGEILCSDSNYENIDNGLDLITLKFHFKEITDSVDTTGLFDKYESPTHRIAEYYDITSIVLVLNDGRRIYMRTSWNDSNYNENENQHNTYIRYNEVEVTIRENSKEYTFEEILADEDIDDGVRFISDNYSFTVRKCDDGSNYINTGCTIDKNLFTDKFHRIIEGE